MSIITECYGVVTNPSPPLNGVGDKVAPNLFVGIEGIIGFLPAANMNVTTDQQIWIRTPNGIKYTVTGLWVLNTSISLTTAQGGLYTAASKGGTALVASTQAYTACTAATQIQKATMASASTTLVLTGSSLYFSLTTPQGAAATADLYIFGVPLP